MALQEVGCRTLFTHSMTVLGMTQWNTALIVRNGRCRPDLVGDGTTIAVLLMPFFSSRAAPQGTREVSECVEADVILTYNETSYRYCVWLWRGSNTVCAVVNLHVQTLPSRLSPNKLCISLLGDATHCSHSFSVLSSSICFSQWYKLTCNLAWCRSSKS